MLKVENLIPAKVVSNPIWEDVISLYKFFTKSVIWGSKCPKLDNKLEIWNLGILKSYFGEVSFSVNKYSQNR